MVEKQWSPEQLMNKANLNREPIPGQFLIEILGKSRIVIENHKGVRSYSENEICINIRRGFLVIHGNSMKIICVCRCYVVISGDIYQITIENEE